MWESANCVGFREGEPEAGVGESLAAHWMPFKPFEFVRMKKNNSNKIGKDIFKENFKSGFIFMKNKKAGTSRISGQIC